MQRFGNKLTTKFSSLNNPFAKNFRQLKVDGKGYNFYSLPDLNDSRLGNNNCETSFFKYYGLGFIIISFNET